MKKKCIENVEFFYTRFRDVFVYRKTGFYLLETKFRFNSNTYPLSLNIFDSDSVYNVNRSLGRCIQNNNIGDRLCFAGFVHSFNHILSSILLAHCTECKC